MKETLITYPLGTTLDSKARKELIKRLKADCELYIIGKKLGHRTNITIEIVL